MLLKNFVETLFSKLVVYLAGPSNQKYRNLLLSQQTETTLDPLQIPPLPILISVHLKMIVSTMFDDYDSQSSQSTLSMHSPEDG
uniref:Ovule protein n=1 Tax=Steinernema glaseri TaxID=37863 RepID=A0A1I7YVQ6_9BILA